MNNFPAMTEEQRQQLIESCQLEIKENPHSPHAQMAKIALAALTAEPVAYTDDEELEDLSKHTFANMFTPRKEYKPDPLWMPLFTAPPAPVLKPIELPKAIQQHETCKYGLESSDAYGLHWGSKETLSQCIEAIRAAGYEVK